MLKKARLLTRPTPARRDAPCPRQGRSERRGEEVQTALRVGRSPFEWILANGKAPPVLPISEGFLLNVEPLSEARTKLADFFSRLLVDEWEEAGLSARIVGDHRVDDSSDSVAASGSLVALA